MAQRSVGCRSRADARHGWFTAGAPASLGRKGAWEPVAGRGWACSRGTKGRLPRATEWLLGACPESPPPQALARARATPDCHGADCHPTAAETWQMGLRRPGEWRCNGRLRSRIKVSPARRRRLRRPSRVHRPSSGAQRPVSTSRPRDRELQRRPSAAAHPPCHAAATHACRCDLAPPAVTAPSPRRRDSSSTPRMSLARHTSAAATARLESRPD